MATRLTLLCAGPTASSRIGAFARPQEPLDAGGARKAAAFRLPGLLPAAIVSSPDRAAIETAAAIGLDPTIEPRLADRRHGDWAGRAIADIASTDPSALAAWFADPTTATPGGEALAAFVSRTASWLDEQADGDRTLLAISHAAVIRAVIAYALGAPIAAMSRIDVAPLSVAEFSFHGHWRLRQLRRAN